MSPHFWNHKYVGQQIWLVQPVEKFKGIFPDQLHQFLSSQKNLFKLSKMFLSTIITILIVANFQFLDIGLELLP